MLFIARNELAYVIRVQEDGFVMRGDPERVGYEHGVIETGPVPIRRNCEWDGL